MNQIIKIVLSFFVVCSVIIGCDVEKKAIKKAEKAFESYGDNELLKSARIFDQLITDYPESKMYAKNVYNAAVIYQEIDSMDAAIMRYEKLLHLDISDNQKDSTRSIWETRTNFKHNACKNIGHIYHQKGNYELSKSYLLKSKFDFPIYSDSVQTVKREVLDIDIELSKIYIAQGQMDSALLVMLPHALTKSPWNIHKAKLRTLDIIHKHFVPKTVLEELRIAFEKVRLSPTFASLVWHGHQVILIPYESEVTAFTTDNLKKTGLYIDLYRTVYHAN